MAEEIHRCAGSPQPVIRHQQSVLPAVHFRPQLTDRTNVTPDAPDIPPARPRVFDRPTIIAVAAGAALAGIVLALPRTDSFWLSLPARGLDWAAVMLHEIGHCVTAWLFGYPSIPAFDLRYGGGVTWITQRRPAVLVIVYLALAGWAFLVRRRPRRLAAVGALAAAHAALAFSAGHQMLISFMGHGGELAFAGYFLYRGLRGRAVLARQERIAYAMVGLFVLAKNALFAVGLATSERARILYGLAKGGGHRMDFDVLARQYLRVELTTMAWLFLACCLAVPIVSYLLCRRAKAGRAPDRLQRAPSLPAGQPSLWPPE
jgi:hypothetical protein